MQSIQKFDNELAQWVEGKTKEEVLQRAVDEAAQDDMYRATHLCLLVQSMADGEEDPFFLRSKLLEAVVSAKRNNVSVALNEFQKLLTPLTKLLGKDHSEVISAHLERGFLLQRQGSNLKKKFWNQANSSLKNAIKSIEKTSGPDDYRLIKAYYVHSRIAKQGDLLNETKQYLDRMVKVCKACLGEDDPEFAWVILIETQYMLEQEDVDLEILESQIEKAKSIYSKCFGEDDYEVSTCLNLLAKIQKKAGKLDESEKTRSRSMELRNKMLEDRSSHNQTLAEKVNKWRSESGVNSDLRL